MRYFAFCCKSNGPFGHWRLYNFRPHSKRVLPISHWHWLISYLNVWHWFVIGSFIRCNVYIHIWWRLSFNRWANSWWNECRELNIYVKSLSYMILTSIPFISIASERPAMLLYGLVSSNYWAWSLFCATNGIICIMSIHMAILSTVRMNLMLAERYNKSISLKQLTSIAIVTLPRFLTGKYSKRINSR